MAFHENGVQIQSGRYGPRSSLLFLYARLLLRQPSAMLLICRRVAKGPVRCVLLAGAGGEEHRSRCVSAGLLSESCVVSLS